MAIKTHFSKKDFLAILSDYTLGEYKSSEPLAEGTVQTNFLVKTTKGRFVFRHYENRSRGSVAFETNLIEYLKKRNYPCPAAFRNKRGDLIGNYKRKPYVIFEFIEGRHVRNPSERQKEQLIQKVAELHNLTKKYSPKNKKYRWNYSVALCKKLARKEARRLDTPDVKKKLSWFLRVASSLQLPKSLPKGVCHCDFHFSNVLFKGATFKALIDFDDANYTFLLFDLAGLINPFLPSFEWNTWSKFKKDQNVFSFGEALKVVLEYTKYRPLTLTEKKHLFDVFKLSTMFDCVWHFDRGNPNDFYEKRKIEHLDSLGRKAFYERIFG